MGATYLALCQAVAGELGLNQPSTIVLAQDAQSQQLGALVRRMGQMLLRAKDGGWSMLRGEWTLSLSTPSTMTGATTYGARTITGLSSTASLTAGLWVVQGTNFVQAPRVMSVDSATQVTLDTAATATATGISFTFAQDTFAVPSDFKAFVNDTMWDRSRRWSMVGPMTPQEEQMLRSGIIAPVPRRRFIQVGRTVNSFRIWPPPTSGDTPATLIFDYLSTYWAQSAAGVPQGSFIADTDTAVWDDDLFILGAKWLFLQAKGFAFEDIRAQWQAMLDESIASDGGASELSMAPKRIWDPLDPAAVNITVVQS